MTLDDVSTPASRLRKPTCPALGWRKLATWYKVCALTSFNAFILFLFCNGILALVFHLSPSMNAQAGPASLYPEASLAAVYPGFDPSERTELLRETWSRPLASDDFTHFKEGPYSGKYVNITKAGYRKSNQQGPWPPSKENVSVFVFGASTTFGYGLPDEQTVPSYLQQAFSQHTKRPVAVYNFGVGYYYLTQERIRFERLLMDGYIPDIAIFIDGISEEFNVYDRPWNRLGVGLDSSQPRGAQMTFVSFLRSLPVARAGIYLRDHIPGRKEEADNTPSVNTIQAHLRRFWANQRMIRALGREYGFSAVFVWQPSPFYKYDLKYHLFCGPHITSPLYTAMAAQVQEKSPPLDFLWCADIQEHANECLYVDQVHYNAKLAKELADRICGLCLERHLLVGHGIGVQ